MGRVVTFAQLPAGESGEGVRTAPITGGDTREMAAEFVRIEPGKRLAARVPHGSDCYLFVLDGSGAIAAGQHRHPLAAHTFATVQEGVEFAIESDARSPAQIVKVLAPPRCDGNKLAGF